MTIQTSYLSTKFGIEKAFSNLTYLPKWSFSIENNFCAPNAGSTWLVSAKSSHLTNSCPIQKQFLCLFGNYPSKNEGSGAGSLLIMPAFLTPRLPHRCHYDDTGLPLPCLAPETPSMPNNALSERVKRAGKANDKEAKPHCCVSPQKQKSFLCCRA